MQIITIGSCLSRNIALWMVRDYAVPVPLNQVFHVNSDQLVKYYIDRTLPIPPEDIFDRIIEYDPKHEDFVRLMIRNVQPHGIGLAEYTSEQQAGRTNLIETLATKQVDLIICDNLFELTNARYFVSADIDPVYANSPMNIPIWFCTNYRELNRKLRRSAGPLSPAESAQNWVRVLDWLRQLQPKARLVFSCCPANTSREVAPDRAERAAVFYSVLLAELGDRPVEVIPPWDIPAKYTNDEDWTHFHASFYRSLAGHLFMTNVFGRIPEHTATWIA